jgi:hypothetical protein
LLGDSEPTVQDKVFPPVPPAWLEDPEAQHVRQIARVRALGLWSHFVDWCALRDLPSLPSTGPTVAAYLINRISELDEFGRMAHSHSKGWVKLIDDVHSAAAHERPGSSPEVREVLSRHRVARDRARPTPSNSPAHQLGKVVRAIESSATGVRDTAIILIGALGAMRYADLATLTASSALLVPGDGVWLDLSAEEEGTWIGSVGVRGLCAPCAIRRWMLTLASPTPPNYVEVAWPEDIHLCVVAPKYLPMLTADTPLFPHITNEAPLRREKLDLAGIRDIVTDRFARVNLVASDAKGARDELLIGRVLNEFVPAI